MATENDVSVRNESVSPEESASNKSFVKKVTSRVSGFLPSSISKWFGSAETSVRPRDETDDEDVLRIQPPAKRAKANESPIRHNHRHSFVAPRSEIDRSKNNLNCVKFPEPIAGPSGLASKRHSTATKAALNVNLCTPKHGEVRNCDNNSDSGESTSGYSSMRVGSKELITENIEQVKLNPVASPEKSKILYNTPSKHDRSLFNDRTSSPYTNTSLSTRQPSFNSTAFGSSNFVDRTLSSKRILDSPFYSGRTTYGGASAYGRRLAQKSQNSAIVRNSIQIKPVNEKKSDSTSLSKTARRILDTLEQYTAPTADAKKIPNPPKKLSRYSHINPYAIRETKVPSNRELQVPTVPDLLKMKLKEKMQNTTVSVRRIANSSKCSLNTEEYKIATLDEDSSSKHLNKIKNKIASVREKPELNETVKELKLPDVQLPITTLPVFNFSIPAPSISNISKPIETISSITTTVKTTEKITIDCSEKNTEVKKTEQVIKETLRKDNNKMEQSTSKSDKTECVKQTEYVFSHPTVISENKVKQDDFGGQFKVGNDKWECKTCMVRNNTTESNCKACTMPRIALNGTAEHSSQKYAYTFSDPVPVVDSKKTKPISNGPIIKNDLLQFKMPADKWECSTCLVRNNSLDTKCIACTSPRITNGSVLPGMLNPYTVKNMFGDKFKPPSDTWECSVCMIRNKNDAKMCLACSSPKQIGKQENGLLDKPEIKPTGIFDKFKPPPNAWPASKIPADTWKCHACVRNNKNDTTICATCMSQRKTEKSTLKPNPLDKFKPESDTWECPTCMVRNKNNITVCVACAALKPGLTSKQENGFGDKFKKKDDQWECGTCMVKNSVEKQTCICCDTPKPGSKQPTNIPKETKPVSSFNFGIVNNEAVGQLFSFGIKKNESAPSKPTSSIFGQPPPASTTTFNFGIKPVENKIDLSTSTESTISEEKKVLPDTNKPMIKPHESTSKPVPPTTTTALTPIKSTLNGDMNKTPILFGNVPKSTEVTVASSTPMFLFGTPSKPQVPESNAVTPVPQTFVFGAATTTSGLFATNSSISTTPALTANPATVSSPFKFGASTATPTKPPFETPSVEKPTLFGNLTTPGSTNFGSTTTSQPSGGFNFENVPTNPLAPSQNGAFAFGNATEAPKPMFNFGTQQTGSPGVFSFGRSAPTSTASSVQGGFNFSNNADFKPNFNFTAGAPPSTFNAPSINSAPERRVIRRALRRTQR